MAESRSLVFPRAIGMGARPLTVPKRGAVLAVSSFYAFRLSDGASILPATWYETVATRVGDEALPDSLAPVPGAELLVFGQVPPVAERTRDVSIRCGDLSRSLVLRRDPEAPDVPFLPDHRAAAWHKDDNPEGRGGPDDRRPPLLVGAGDPERPIWLGPTPLDHPYRLRLAGTPDVASGTGWPSDADPAVLCQTHPSFWAESFSPGDALVCEGLGAAPIDTRLPPYRMTIVSGDEEGDFTMQPARIHGVTLIPEADAAAVFWRVAIDLGDDILGDSIQMLIVALEDADSPPKDVEHWWRIGADRWAEPEAGLDDRPLLPAALAAAVVLPFALPDDDVFRERREAAEQWMKDEGGMPEENPFEDLAPEETGLAEQAVESVEQDDGPPPAVADVDGMAQQVLGVARKRHEEAGFVDPPEDRPTEPRGERLPVEIAQRLSAPFQSPRDLAIANTIRQHATEGGLEADEVAEKLADARRISADPPTVWPGLEEEEARQFGDAVYERLQNEDLARHVDVASAALVARAGTPGARRIEGRRFDGVFAEDTVWEDTVFAGCAFAGTSFARARFKDCEFRHCEFDDANLSRTEFAGCKVSDCRFSSLQATELSWFESHFLRCAFEEVSLTDVAMRDNVFEGGEWKKVDLSDGLMMDTKFLDMTLSEVTLAEFMAPRNHFERVTLWKLWMMGSGPAGSVFKAVEADTCGFLGTVRFDQSSFTDVRFSMTGFTGAVFGETEFAPDCQFDRCDLSNALFVQVGMEGVRFIECTMIGSVWQQVKASNAWFFGSVLRAVDFADTELLNAVFADADLEGTKFLPDQIIGADFRGTVRAPPEQS